MDTIKINLNNKIYGTKELDVDYILDMGDRLLIVFMNQISSKIFVGQEIEFRRYFYSELGAKEYISSNVTVLEETIKSASVMNVRLEGIYTTKPYTAPLLKNFKYPGKVSIKNSKIDCETNGDSYFDEDNRYLVTLTDAGFVIDDSLYYYSGTTASGDSYEYFILEFSDEHNIFAQDTDIANSLGILGGYSIFVENGNNGLIGSFKHVSIPTTGDPRPANKFDCITEEKTDTCGKFDDNLKPVYQINRKYTQVPSKISRRKIIFSECETGMLPNGSTFFEKVKYLLENGVFFVPKYTPYYFDYVDANTLEHKVSFWEDQWWTYFETSSMANMELETVETDGIGYCSVELKYGYWNIPMLEVSNSSYDGLMADGYGETYANSVIDQSIPKLIDFEKLKYTPVCSGETEIDDIETITMYLHFRKRAHSESNGYKEYKEGWYIDEDSELTTWWNGMSYAKSALTPNAMNTFITTNGKVSDMLGDLGFTDDDVYFRKSKLSKSFIRLSFYNSNDPISQKLLFYSTIFLDATTMFGRYMKQYIYKADRFGEDGKPLVFFDDDSVSARLDTKITIHGENFTDSSSEGFNLYLFADDEDIVDSGKDYRTIYMKVEFNHAGVGKTIPMLVWPKNEDGDPTSLTVENFLNSLYIPVRVFKKDGRHLYEVEGSDCENGNLELVLFEPKLDASRGEDEKFTPRVSHIEARVTNKEQPTVET